MALFLFFVGKELWEALIFERGALSGARAGLPLGAVIGGTTGAVIVWLIVSALIETAEEATLGAGWPVPIGSDVVVAYLVGRIVFGAGHPALHLLLLITIAFDILGLAILGFASPAGGLRLAWLIVPVAATLGVWLLYGRRARLNRSERSRRRGLVLWPYVIAGIYSYIGTAAAGLPAALGLLPIIPAIPHADRAFGLFAEAEAFLHDPLNRLAHLLVKPLAVVLALFGLTHGGIDLTAFAPTTLTTLAALWIGKPIGVILGCLIAMRVFGLPLPQGVRVRDIGLVAVITGIGFTVPALALDTALPGGAMVEAARLGLALSLLAGPAAIGLARFYR